MYVSDFRSQCPIMYVSANRKLQKTSHYRHIGVNIVTLTIVSYVDTHYRAYYRDP